LKVNYFGKLVLDTVPQVRFAFIQTLGDWMTSLVERVDHEPRLLPYVVSAVADGDTKVSTYALELIEKLGAQYEMEHEKDLKPVMTYMPEFLEGVSLHNTHVKPLYPAPFLERPRLGARVLVKNNFPAVVNPILAEIGGWQADARKYFPLYPFRRLIAHTRLTFIFYNLRRPRGEAFTRESRVS
jgi:hypothetical protein